MVELRVGSATDPGRVRDINEDGGTILGSSRGGQDPEEIVDCLEQLAVNVLIVIGGAFLLREFVPWFDWRVWWPAGLIALGALFLVFALRPDRPAE